MSLKARHAAHWRQYGPSPSEKVSARKATPFNGFPFSVPLKSAPPKESWWLCDPKDFALEQRKAQARMSGATAIYPKASGEQVE